MTNRNTVYKLYITKCSLHSVKIESIKARCPSICMKRHKDAVESPARHITSPLIFSFLFAVWMLAAESPAYSFAIPAPQDSIHGEDGMTQLQVLKVRNRGRSLEKESLLKARAERIAVLEAEADSAFKVQNYALARKRVRQVLTLDAHHRRALEILASVREAEQGKSAEKLSFGLFRDETPHLSKAEKEKMIAVFLARGKRLLRNRQYDAAVDEIENVFVLDPLNTKASRLIDRARESFVREKKSEWKKKAARAGEDFSDKMELSLSTVKSLIKAKEYMQARVILNRMAFLEPDNKQIRKLMGKIQQLEAEEAKSKAA